MKHIYDLDEETILSMRDYNNKSDKWENKRPNYTNQYSKHHIDLIKDCGYPLPSLQDLCAINGVQVKTVSNGSSIEELYKNKKYDLISEYCKEDVFATTELFLKYYYRDIKINKNILINFNNVKNI